MFWQTLLPSLPEVLIVWCVEHYACECFFPLFLMIFSPYIYCDLSLEY